VDLVMTKFLQMIVLDDDKIFMAGHRCLVGIAIKSAVSLLFTHGRALN
jgi:hypothetical protein